MGVKPRKERRYASSVQSAAAKEHVAAHVLQDIDGQIAGWKKQARSAAAVLRRATSRLRSLKATKQTAALNLKAAKKAVTAARRAGS